MSWRSGASGGNAQQRGREGHRRIGLAAAMAHTEHATDDRRRARPEQRLVTPLGRQPAKNSFLRIGIIECLYNQSIVLYLKIKIKRGLFRWRSVLAHTMVSRWLGYSKFNEKSESADRSRRKPSGSGLEWKERNNKQKEKRSKPAVARSRKPTFLFLGATRQPPGARRE